MTCRLNEGAFNESTSATRLLLLVILAVMMIVYAK